MLSEQHASQNQYGRSRIGHGSVGCRGRASWRRRRRAVHLLCWPLWRFARDAANCVRRRSPRRLYWSITDRKQDNKKGGDLGLDPD